MPVEIGTYKGKPTITLDPGSRFPFTFGSAKAKLIVDNIDEIKKFVAKYAPSQPDRHDMAVEDEMARRAGVA